MEYKNDFVKGCLVSLRLRWNDIWLLDVVLLGIGTHGWDRSLYSHWCCLSMAGTALFPTFSQCVGISQLFFFAELPHVTHIGWVVFIRFISMLSGSACWMVAGWPWLSYECIQCGLGFRVPTSRARPSFDLKRLKPSVDLSIPVKALTLTTPVLGFSVLVTALLLAWILNRLYVWAPFLVYSGVSSLSGLCLSGALPFSPES